MDWGVANFFKLSTATFDRRGRDAVAMQQAEGMRFELETNPEFVRPHGEKGVEEWIKKIFEYRTAVNTYDSADAAEADTLEMVRQNLSFNRSRAKNVRNVLGWIPGSGAVLRWLAVQEPEHLPILKYSKRWKNFLEKNNLIGVKIAHLPHSAAEAVSLGVRFFGPETEDWDIHRIDHIIDMLEHKGVFAQNPQYYGMLRREFGTTTLSRLLDIPRKYWWVIIAATVAVAALESMEEEKRQHK
jgi:hypothetical protein